MITKMKTNNEIIELRYKELITICNNICSVQKYKNDFKQEMLLILILMKNKLINDLDDDGKLMYYFTRICKNNWYSKTSPFYIKYIKINKYVVNVEDYSNIDENFLNEIIY